MSYLCCHRNQDIYNKQNKKKKKKRRKEKEKRVGSKMLWVLWCRFIVYQSPILGKSAVNKIRLRAYWLHQQNRLAPPSDYKSIALYLSF